MNDDQKLIEEWRQWCAEVDPPPRGWFRANTQDPTVKRDEVARVIGNLINAFDREVQRWTDHAIDAEDQLQRFMTKGWE